MANPDCNRDQVLHNFKLSTPVFQALGDVNRQEIIILLLENGPLNVNQITERMEISRPAISHHLKILRQASIISFVKSGKEKYYSLSGETVRESFRHVRDLIEALRID